MSSSAGRIATKAAVATAVVGGGAIVFGGSSSAGAQEVPPWLEDLGQQLITEYGPQVLEFVEGLRPEDDPNVAETTADSSGAISTAIQNPEFTFGQSEATPTSAKVTILRIGETDILTKEGDENGGHYGGVAPWLGEGIDWVNERTCPSGPGGEDLCITFLGSNATTTTTTEGQPVSLTMSTRSVARQLLPSSIPTSIINFLIPSTATTTATGVSEGVSTDNSADFHLFRASKGGDSISFLPTSAHSGSFELGDGEVSTSPFTLRIFGQNVTVPSLTVPVSGLPRTCTSSGNASNVEGTGIFTEIAAFFDHPKSSAWGEIGSEEAECEIELVEPTSSNTPLAA